MVVRHGNSLSYKLNKFPYLILSPLRNPIFSKLFDKKSKKEGTNLFRFFIRKLSGNRRKLKRDFELQALNQSSLEFLFYAYKTLKINVPYWEPKNLPRSPYRGPRWSGRPLLRIEGANISFWLYKSLHINLHHIHTAILLRVFF